MTNPLGKTLLLVIQILFLFSIPLQFGPHFWQSNTSVSGFRIDYLSGYIYFSDIFAIGVVLVDLLVIKSFIKNKWVIKVGVCLLIYNLFQLLWVNQWLAHMFWSLRIFAGLLAFNSISHNINQLKKYIFMIVMCQCLVITTLNLMQALMQASIGGLWHFLGERTFSVQTPGIAKLDLFGVMLLRPYAFFSHPNTMAGYLLILGMIGNRFVGESYSIVKKIILLLLVSISVLLSFSQIAWIGLLCLLLVFLLPNIKIKKVSIYPQIYLLVGIVAMLSPLLLIPFSSIREDILMRNNILLNTKFLSPILILFGSGWFGSIIAKHNYLNVLSFQPIHNVLWEIVYSCGLLPFVTFIFLIRNTLRTLIIKLLPIFTIELLTLTILIMFDHYLITQTQALYGSMFYLTTIKILNEN